MAFRFRESSSILMWVRGRKSGCTEANRHRPANSSAAGALAVATGGDECLDYRRPVEPFRGGNCPQRVAARSRCNRSSATACCSSAIRSAAAIKPWVGRTQAVGHRVIPFDRINSAIASPSSSDIFLPPSPPTAPDCRRLLPFALEANRKCGDLAFCVNN
jgi:hypothetical protein